MSVCIQCGEYKQAPTSRCSCGFLPARGSTDEAKSYILTTQFRTPEELEEIARLIKAGVGIPYDERELRIASTIKHWNLAVNLSFIVAAALFGLLFALLAMWIVGRYSDFPIAGIAITGLLFVLAVVIAYVLMGHVDEKAERPSPT